MYYMYYLTGIILLPAILLAIYAQSKVTSTYKKYMQVSSSKGITASQLTKVLLDCAGLSHLYISKVNGTLSDHYDHKNKTVGISSGNYDSTSVASLGIAAHEVGHALQFKENYLPIKIRSFFIPVVNFSSALLFPLVIIGLIFNFAAMPGSIIGEIFIWAGVILFGAAALLDLITLPVEFNASKRALKILKDSNILNEEELVGAKKVLSAAALTYVAALLTSLLNLLRFVLVILMSRSGD